jgi:hypothetical protein
VDWYDGAANVTASYEVSDSYGAPISDTSFASSQTLTLADGWYYAWNKLDKETGEQMFRKLVDEVRGTFKGVEKI